MTSPSAQMVQRTPKNNRWPDHVGGILLPLTHGRSMHAAGPARFNTISAILPPPAHSFFFVWLLPSRIAMSDFTSPCAAITCILPRHFNHCHVISHCIHKPHCMPFPFPLSWQLHPQHPSEFSQYTHHLFSLHVHRLHTNRTNRRKCNHCLQPACCMPL